MCSNFLTKMGKVLSILTVLIVGACVTTGNPLDQFEELTPTTMMEAPAPAPEQGAAYDPRHVQQGKYLVELLGCGTCHTDGALIGEPNFSRRLAGSRIGIAYSNPLKQKYPGVVYPANLTPDRETGLGSWSDDEIIRMIRSGVDKHGRHQLSVMPWPAYTKLTGEDAYAIVAYLRSLPAVRHRVPDNVKPGKKAIEPYIHFGTYRSRK